MFQREELQQSKDSYRVLSGEAFNDDDEEIEEEEVGYEEPQGLSSTEDTGENNPMAALAQALLQALGRNQAGAKKEESGVIYDGLGNQDAYLSLPWPRWTTANIQRDYEKMKAFMARISFNVSNNMSICSLSS